jgi:uncharacterized membrane protein
MRDIPLEAQVECADGPCGESLAVIVDPTTQTVTHFAVLDRTAPDPIQRLVPIDQIEETTPSLVRLRCTKADLEGMEPFTETHYIKTDPYYYGYYDAYTMPYALPMAPLDVPVDTERVPPGELAVHRGTFVEATDGYIGKVGELVANPADGHITHLVLQSGHLWGKKEIVLPLSAIDHVEGDVVTLKLDKQAIGTLPAIPVKRNYGGWADHKIELIARVFNDPDQATEALEFVRDLQRRKVIRILNAAVLARDEQGNATVRDIGDLGPKRGRLFGAITGGLMGLFAGPAGAVVGALAGAGTGAAAAKRIDRGFSDQFLAELTKMLEPGRSALVVLVGHEWLASASEALADLEGVVVQQTLTDELVRRLMGPDGAEV